MSEGAYVGSFAAVRDFRAALVTFLHEAREAVAAHDDELARAIEWLAEVQPSYWKHQARLADDAVTAAKIELERCRVSKLPGGGTPSCMEEKKLYERARARREHVHDKIEATKRWRHAIEREALEYSSRANQLATLFDADMPQALATLERVLAALESYAALSAPQTGGGSFAGSTAATDVASIARPAADSPPAAGADVAREADRPESDAQETTS